MPGLITGGHGFLGRHVRDQGPLRAPTSAELDLTVPATIELWLTEDIELVIHAAAFTDPQAATRDPERCRAVNVEGTRNLVDAMRRLTPHARLVHVSTCHVYGLPQVLPVPEDHPLAATGIYARSKVEAEAVVQSSGLDAVRVRPFNLTGPGQPIAHAPADWAAQARGGAEFIRCGNLDAERDYMDARDAARGLWMLADKGRSGEAYNLCTGEGVTMRWILEAVAPGIRVIQDPARMRPSDVPVLVGDPRAARDLGWSPQVPLLESLQELARTG